MKNELFEGQTIDLYLQANIFPSSFSDAILFFRQGWAACFRRRVKSDKIVHLYIWVEEKHSMRVYMHVCTQLWIHVHVCDCCHKTLMSLSGEAAWQDECNWLSQLYLCMLIREAGLHCVLQRQIKNAKEHRQVNRRCVNIETQTFTLCRKALAFNISHVLRNVHMNINCSNPDAFVLRFDNLSHLAHRYV